MSAMSDQKKMHTDLNGNEHFQASEAEWADRDIRRKRAKGGSEGGSAGEIMIVACGILVYSCYKLMGYITKSVENFGLSHGVSDIVGKVIAGAVLLFLLSSIYFAGSPRNQFGMCLFYLIIAVTVIFIFF